MTATTLTPTRRTTWPVGLALGSVAGAALVDAGVWNTLVQGHVTVSPPPTLSAGLTQAQAMQQHYTWYAGTVAQERGVAIVAMIGVIGLALLADALRRRVGERDLLGRAACSAVFAGSIVWVVGQLAALGGHRAVALMATHGNPIQGVNEIAFTVDLTEDAFSAAAFVLLGLAMVAIGIAPVRSRATGWAGPGRAGPAWAGPAWAGPGWAGLSTVTGVVSLAVAIGYVQGIDAITTYVLGILAVILLPAWVVWTGRLLDSTPSV